MLGRRAEVALDNPRTPRTVLDAGIVAGAGGGIEKTLLAGARFHEGAGYRSVLAFVHPASDPGFEKLRSRGAARRVELHDRAETFPFSPLTVAWFARLCREHGVDIWHAHDYKTDLIGLLLQPLLGFSLVSTLHGWSEDTRRTRLYFALDRRVIRRYEHVIAVSSALHAEARRLGVPNERLSLIENGVDTERRVQLAKFRSPGGRMHGAGNEAHAGGIVAQQQDDVGFEFLGLGADTGDPLRGHPRLAGMDVGNDCDAQFEAGRPAGRMQRVVGDPWPSEGLDERVSGSSKQPKKAHAEEL